jgi:hypothetical protein
VRSYLSILIVFLMLWQIIGFFGYFEFSHHRIKKEIKKQIKEGVPAQQLVHFSFTEKELNQLTWIKSHEFKLNGSLFDVVRKKKTTDGYHLECISDKQETVLFANLERMVNSDLNDQHENPGLACWIKLLSSPLLSFTGDFTLKINGFTAREFHRFNYKYSIISFFVDVPTEPPLA